MVDSAVNPVDGPTKLEQRNAADLPSQDDRYPNADEQKAQNVRDYHQGEISRLERAIEQHQAIVDTQDEILSHPSARDRDPEEPLENGTDIGEIFNEDPDSPDADPGANVDQDEELDNLTDDQLRDLAAARNLDTNGERNDLIERIREDNDESNSPSNED